MKLIRSLITVLGILAIGANAATWKSKVKVTTAYIVYNLNGTTNSLVVQISDPANPPSGVLEYIYTIDPNSSTSIHKANSLFSAALTAVSLSLPANLLVESSSLLGIGFSAP